MPPEVDMAGMVMDGEEPSEMQSKAWWMELLDQLLISWEQVGEELTYTVRGSGFLHHMVRNLVGTFILVGKGTLQIEDVTRILEARSRSAAGATAPASGLYLVSVEY